MKFHYSALPPSSNRTLLVKYNYTFRLGNTCNLSQDTGGKGSAEIHHRSIYTISAM